MEKNQITDIEEIVAAAPSHTIRELQSMTGLSYHRIWTLLARRGVSPLKKGRSVERITKEALEGVYAQGPLTLVEAAAKLNCYPAQISVALRRHGMAPDGERLQSTRSKFTADRAFKVLAALKANPDVCLASIGREFNCSREYVRQVRECATINGLI